MPPRNRGRHRDAADGAVRLHAMSSAHTIDPAKIFRIYGGSTEPSPFHRCYENENTVLRVCAGRFFAHCNGEDPVAAYWALRRQAILVDTPERPLEISGRDSLPFLERIFTRKVANLEVGQGHYTLACTFSGGVFMDGILFRLARDRFWFVQPDGSMHTWLLAHCQGFNIKISDPNSRAIQIQGPRSLEIMNSASGGAIDANLRYFGCGYFDIGGQSLLVSRTGWTGELGYEIYVQGEKTDCPRLWDHLMEVGGPKGLVFSSMKAMNIRRIEAGILDSGGDFDDTMTPFEAGLGKFADLGKEGFIGREALLNARRGKRIFGLICSERTPGRDCNVFDGGEQVGIVTTGAQSPFLGAGIGYARFFREGNWPGRELTIRSDESGGAACRIVDPPFYDRAKNIPRGKAPVD